MSTNRNLFTRRHFATAFTVASTTLALLGIGATKDAHAQAERVIVYRVDIGQRDTVLTTFISEVTSILANYGGSTVTKLGTASSVPNGSFTLPIYRLVNNFNGHHFATASETEKNVAIAGGAYTVEFIIGYAKAFTTSTPGDNVSIHRFYSPSKELHYFATSGFSFSPGSGLQTKGDQYVPRPQSSFSNLYDAILPAGSYNYEGTPILLGGLPTP